MKHNQLKSLYCAVGLLTASQATINAGYYDRYDYPRNEVRPEEVVLGVVGGIAAGLGIYALGSYMEWWGAPSNEELRTKGNAYLNQTTSYRTMLELVRQIRNAHRDLEETLYEIAMLRRSSSTISTYISLAKKLVDDLQSHADTIDRRISDIKRKGSYQDRADLNALQRISAELHEARCNMHDIFYTLQEHRTYFTLFETEDALAQKYAREIAAVQQYGCSDVRAVRTSMCSRYNGAFGLIHAVRDLQADINRVHTALREAAYHYTHRVTCARQLGALLQCALDAIVADPEYGRLLIQYEAAEREKERLRLERERVANEQRIAAAKEREAYAKEREARAREEQNRLKEKENRLKEQELYDNRMQANQQRMYR